MSIESTFTQFPSLTTERLFLRQIRMEDADAMFPILSDPQVTEFYGDEPQQSLDETSEFILLTLARYMRRESILWAITFKEEDRFIGSCSFHHFGANFYRAEVGYELGKVFWGKGIMTEAVAAILTYGFAEMNFHRIEAIIDIANDRSKGLLLKLGFTYEGNLRQRYPFRGRFDDEHYFGLLKDEWNSRV